MHVQHNIAAIKVNMMLTLTALRSLHTLCGGVRFTMMDGPSAHLQVTREASIVSRCNPGQPDQWHALREPPQDPAPRQPKYDIGETVADSDGTIETLNGHCEQPGQQIFPLAPSTTMSHANQRHELNLCLVNGPESIGDLNRGSLIRDAG
jgi:hypothetical protein